MEHGLLSFGVLTGYLFLAFLSSSETQEFEGIHNNGSVQETPSELTNRFNFGIPNCTFTTLHTAVYQRNISLIYELIKEGANMYVRDCYGFSPMELAIRENNKDIIIIFVQNLFDLRAKDEFGNSLLHKSVESGSQAALEALLEFGSFVDEANANDELPLTKAVQLNNVDMINLLLKNGANITQKTMYGQTYLHIAIENNRTEALKALLSQGLPADTENDNGETPILHAVRKNDTNAMDHLLAYKADINQMIGGWSLLHEAARWGNVKAVIWLLDHGIPINLPDGSGWTPLHWAARYGQLDVINLLMDKGACINCQSINGHTPLWASIIGKQRSTIPLLIFKGARLSDEDLSFKKFPKYKPL